MRNGIAGLRGYQIGGIVDGNDPDDWLEKLFRMLQERGIVGSEPPDIPDIRFFDPEPVGIDPDQIEWLAKRKARDEYVLRRILEDDTIDPKLRAAMEYELNKPPARTAPELVDEDFLARLAAREAAERTAAENAKESQDLLNRLNAYYTDADWEDMTALYEAGDEEEIALQILGDSPSATGSTEGEVAEDLIRQIDEDLRRTLPHTMDQQFIDDMEVFADPKALDKEWETLRADRRRLNMRYDDMRPRGPSGWLPIGEERPRIELPHIPDRVRPPSGIARRGIRSLVRPAVGAIGAAALSMPAGIITDVFGLPTKLGPGDLPYPLEHELSHPRFDEDRMEYYREQMKQLEDSPIGLPLSHFSRPPSENRMARDWARRRLGRASGGIIGLRQKG